MGDLVTKDSFELYTHYIALKKHFTSDDYDYFKYNGKLLSLTAETLGKRRDKSFFYTLAHQRRKPKEYVFANILNNPSVWIGDIAIDREESDKVFAGWERRMQSLTYIFREEVGQLDMDFDTNFQCTDGKHPPLLRLFLRKKISLETLTILDMILGFVRSWDKRMNTDPVWNDISRRIKKYEPFLQIDLPKFRQILKDRFV